MQVVAGVGGGGGGDCGGGVTSVPATTLCNSVEGGGERGLFVGPAASSALQQQLHQSGSCCCEEYGGSEEELSVLPRHTKVVVTGNNRTKSVLVGLQGVVKKAVGLGGWHWLVLTNGTEVKLQRNALSVIEAPTGHEDDDSIEYDNMHWNGSDLASDDTQNSHKPRQRQHKPVGFAHKGIGKSHSLDSNSKFSSSPSSWSTNVDLSKLETTALRRYSRHFNLVDSIPNPSKEQLIDAVQRHIMSQVIVGFVQAAKRLKTVCN